MSITSTLFPPAAPVSTGTPAAASEVNADLFSSKMVKAVEPSARTKPSQSTQPKPKTLVADVPPRADDPAFIQKPGKPDGYGVLKPSLAEERAGDTRSAEPEGAERDTTVAEPPASIAGQPTTVTQTVEPASGPGEDIATPPGVKGQIGATDAK
ncbi:hypothetical protein CVH10_17295, partial [Halomonas sp. ND22Bw]